MAVVDLERASGDAGLTTGLTGAEREAAIAQKFCYEQPDKKPYPCMIAVLRRYIFKLFLLAVTAVSATVLGLNLVHAEDRSTFVETCKQVSVPIVCLLFTWVHVWMALQMVFYPVKFFPFFPCCRRCRTPIVEKRLGLPINGWQGIIPNRIHKMARQACEVMIGNVVSFDELMDRVTPDSFFVKLRDSVGSISTTVLERIMVKRFPLVWDALPDSVKAELKERVLDEANKTVQPAMDEIKANINSIVDLKEMCIDALTKSPQTFIDIFQETGAREMAFIQHVAAVMGFFCGCLQLFVYRLNLGKNTDYWMLPTSGLIIGYFTNWLALKMTFAPLWPHVFCGGYINIQGVLMKRQREVAQQMAELVCRKVVDARAVLQYIIQTTPDGAEKLLEMYQRNLSATVDESVGAVRGVMPTIVGQGIEDIKKDVVDISLEVLPDHLEAVEKYMDEVMRVQETLSWRLARLQPPQFERIVHPIFEEDEWLLYLLGGVLGIVVGLLQAFALQQIH